VAVLPFAATGERAEVLAPAVTEALREALRQVRAVRLPDSAALVAAAARGDVSLGDDFSDDAGLALARELRARALVRGTAAPDGEGVAVTARLWDLAKPGEPVRIEESGPVERLEALQAKLTRKLLARLGLTESEAEGRRLDGLAAAPPVPLATYALYARARWQQGLGTREAQEQAVTLFGQALETEPNFARAHFALGLSLLATNNRWRAAGEIRKALQIDPGFADAYRTLGDFLVNSPRRLYDQAVQAYQKALDVAPDMAEAYVGMGDARQAKGEYDAALQEYRRALALEPDNARVHLGMGRIYYQEKQQYHEAVAEYQQAIALDPSLLDAQMSLADLYEEKGLHREAIQRYQAVLTLEPKHPGATSGLARVYESVDPAQAITEWERYIALARDLPTEKEWVEIAQKHLNRLRREAGR